jgi:hypothetical protein
MKERLPNQLNFSPTDILEFRLAYIESTAGSTRFESHGGHRIPDLYLKRSLRFCFKLRNFKKARRGMNDAGRWQVAGLPSFARDGRL